MVRCKVFTFLGMSDLYQGNARDAIEHLQRALQSPHQEAESLIRWYLAAAEWQLNQRQHVIDELQKITRMNDGFKAKAEETLKRLIEGR